MDAVSRCTADAGALATAKLLEEEEERVTEAELLWLRVVVVRFLGHSSETIEKALLRTHPQPTERRLWNDLGDELRRERTGSLLEFFLQCYLPAILAR